VCAASAHAKHSSSADARPQRIFAGTPASNQALLFAGRPLAPDAALLLPELRLDAFSMGHEVVVYMQPLLTAPVRVYVTGQHGGSSCASSVAGKRLHLEHVEAASSMANIQALLVTRGLTCAPFPSAATRGSCTAAGAEPSSSDVVVNRADGSCCARVRVNESSSLQELVAAIWQAEVKGQAPRSPFACAARADCWSTLAAAVWGAAHTKPPRPAHAAGCCAQGVAVSSLTFYQAHDGCLHAMFGAAARA
jgi:hypothetical protein